MGWTHDYSDAARNRRSAAELSSYQRSTPQFPGTDPRLGIPHILRRRARWVSARLRHQRP
ncbi:hypothetical protein [Streptomyces poonensis]|uniref:Uncharacterized protein n=1 Tax=Streptomyces poonensis TaxID=68255 RepID=A0A918UIY7_9ACTN|nr:hypothetical protein [Streptomyces poonensis]GGZ13769.1 hypothetical protein GCM10010365_37050 [Streptomyces poonensis]GLJ91253.1 hypothetical protein GCM10017589_38590 [Streptomyces poonensis]